MWSDMDALRELTTAAIDESNARLTSAASIHEVLEPIKLARADIDEIVGAYADANSSIQDKTNAARRVVDRRLRRLDPWVSSSTRAAISRGRAQAQREISSQARDARSVVRAFRDTAKACKAELRVAEQRLKVYFQNIVAERKAYAAWLKTPDAAEAKARDLAIRAFIAQFDEVWQTWRAAAIADVKSIAPDTTELEAQFDSELVEVPPRPVSAGEKALGVLSWLAIPIGVLALPVIWITDFFLSVSFLYPWALALFAGGVVGAIIHRALTKRMPSPIREARAHNHEVNLRRKKVISDVEAKGAAAAKELMSRMTPWFDLSVSGEVDGLFKELRTYVAVEPVDLRTTPAFAPPNLQVIAENFEGAPRASALLEQWRVNHPMNTPVAGSAGKR